MVSWLTVPSMNMPDRLAQAERMTSRRLRIDRYRSRTEVTIEHINGALAWLKLPIIENDDIKQNPYYDKSTLYRTLPIQRGVPEEEAVQRAKNQISDMLTNAYPLKILTFNTGTAAAASSSLKNWLDNNTDYAKLDVETMITTTPTHKAHIYKHTDTTNNGPFSEEYTTFIILNNLDTPTVIYKLMTAIMTNLNPFGEQLTTFAEAWLNGDADRIFTVVENYYRVYEEKADERNRNEALEALSRTMIVDRTNEFKARIESIESEINSHFRDIADLNVDLNKAKGAYLLYTLEDQEDKSKELKDFFASCRDKISYIKFTENKLYIVYRTSLMYFEPDMLKRYFESTRDNCVTTASLPIQQLLEDIFINMKYTLLIETGACLNTYNNRVYWADPTSLKHCTREALHGIPNPHHLYYDCWGDNAPLIARALMEKDYIKAILQVFAAMSGLNIADAAVIDKFIREELVYYRDIRCLKNNETGEVITIDQYTRRFEDNASDEANE